MLKIKPNRNPLLFIFIIGFTLVFLCLLLQTVYDKYGQLFYWPWLWFVVLYLPPMLNLYQKKGRKPKNKGYGLIFLTILFVLTTLSVIFLQQLAPSMKEMRESLSRIDTLQKSLFFLVPLELLVLYLIRRKFYSKVEPEMNPFKEPVVFISYNHHDGEVAQQIHDALEAKGIRVIFDKDTMTVGEDIKTFIRNSLKMSNISVSLVSNSSLESAWVAMETINTFFLEEYSENKSFIACYLDDDFFKPDYSLRTVAKIDKEIEILEGLISEHHKQNMDTRDLNDRLTRLRDLRNNLDRIVGRLNDSLSINVNSDNFETGMDKLIEKITGTKKS